MAGGWVRLFRDARDHEVFQDAETWRIFCWCLMKANFTSATFQGHTVAAGSFVTGGVRAADELGMARTTFGRHLKRLEVLGCITVDARARWTTITVCNWGTYQGAEVTPRTEVGQNLDTSNAVQQHGLSDVLSTEVDRSRTEDWHLVKVAQSARTEVGHQMDISNNHSPKALRLDAAEKRTPNGQQMDTIEEFKNLRIKESNTPPPPPPKRSALYVPMADAPEAKTEGEEGGREDFLRGEDQRRIPEAQLAVKACGVNQAVSAVDTAIANGMSIDQILAVVDVFHASPGKWSAGALHSRLTKPGMKLYAPGDGWLDPEPAWKAQRPKGSSSNTQASTVDLEALYGETLDAMTEDQLAGLMVGWAASRIADFPRFGRQHRHFRPELLQTIHRREPCTRVQRQPADSASASFGDRQRNPKASSVVTKPP